MKRKSGSLFNVLLLVFFMIPVINVNVKAQDDKKDCSSTKIEVKNVEGQKALIMKADIPTSEIGQKIGQMYKSLFEHMSANNIEPAGPPFAVYYEFDPEGNTVFETGIPVGMETECAEGLEYKEYPAMKVVTTLYKGSYEKMEKVYADLEQYIIDNNHKKMGPVWEVYLTDPQQEENPDNNQTIIYYQVE
jgi:effector-binding domain-containing protein